MNNIKLSKDIEKYKDEFIRTHILTCLYFYGYIKVYKYENNNYYLKNEYRLFPFPSLNEIKSYLKDNYNIKEDDIFIGDNIKGPFTIEYIIGYECAIYIGEKAKIEREKYNKEQEYINNYNLNTRSCVIL